MELELSGDGALPAVRAAGSGADELMSDICSMVVCLSAFVVLESVRRCVAGF
jgi:hypothetical protein